MLQTRFRFVSHSVDEVAKKIKSSKLKYTWRFVFEGKSLELRLFESHVSSKLRLMIQDKLVYEGKLTEEIKKTPLLVPTEHFVVSLKKLNSRHYELRLDDVLFENPLLDKTKPVTKSMRNLIPDDFLDYANDHESDEETAQPNALTKENTLRSKEPSSKDTPKKVIDEFDLIASDTKAYKSSGRKELKKEDSDLLDLEFVESKRKDEDLIGAKLNKGVPQSFKDVFLTEKQKKNPYDDVSLEAIQKVQSLSFVSKKTEAAIITENQRLMEIPSFTQDTTTEVKIPNKKEKSANVVNSVTSNIQVSGLELAQQKTSKGSILKQTSVFDIHDFDLGKKDAAVTETIQNLKIGSAKDQRDERSKENSIPK